MRKRVESVAIELGYSPNPQARSLTSGRTQSMALLIPGATNPYFFDLIRGTQTEAKVRGYRHMLVDTEASAEIEATALAELPRVVDGVVLTGSRLSDSQLLEVSQAHSRSSSSTGRSRACRASWSTPRPPSRRRSTISPHLGHTRTVFLGGPSDSWSSRRRWEALQRAAAQLKIECVRIGPFTDMQSGAAAADAALHHGATACLFFNDMLAIGALKRFAERGVVVPRDISVVGCDDIFGADFCNPPLTTLTAPIDQVARIATDMLLTRLLGLPLPRQHEKVSAHLTVRQSTGTVPTKARRRSEAVRRA